MDKTDTSSKFKNLILNMILIGIAVFVSFKIYGMQEKTIADLRQKSELEVKRNEALSSINLLEKKIVIYKDFFNKKDITAMISNLGEIAKQSDVRIVSVKPVTEKKFPVYTMYPYDLVVEAPNYHVLSKFVNNLESHPDIYMVDKATIVSKSSKDSETGQVVINSDLQISTILVNK